MDIFPDQSGAQIGHPHLQEDPIVLKTPVPTYYGVKATCEWQIDGEGLLVGYKTEENLGDTTIRFEDTLAHRIKGAWCPSQAYFNGRFFVEGLYPKGIYLTRE
jgi:hypothetical protein